MATTYNKMLLDINEKPNDIITAVQNDTNSRYLDVLLYDNGTPIDLTGCEVKIFMEKPEKGGEVWNNGTITDAENGRCEFLLTTEALTHFGHLQVQISIWKENVEILSTQIFEIIVTKSLVGNSSVEASNEYGTLVVLFQNLYEAYDLMTTMVENIGVPAEVAAQYDLDTMWQCWEFLVDYMKGDFTDKVDEAIANSSIQGVLDKLDTFTAKESTSQKIYMGVTGLLSAGSTLTVTPSDDVLLTVLSTEVKGTLNLPTCKVNKIGGTLRIVVSTKNISTIGYHGIVVQDNSGNRYEVVNPSASQTYVTVYADIPVSNGTVLTFTSYSSNSCVNLITICGTLSEPTIDVPNISLV